MRQAFGLLVACLALVTAGCATIGGSALNGNDSTTTPDQIIITPGSGNGSGLPLLALQPGQSLQLSATATKSGLNMTLPGTGAFTWDASYAPAGTTYTRLPAGAVTTGTCTSPFATGQTVATTVPAGFGIALPSNTITAGGSNFTTYAAGTLTNTIVVVPLIAGSLPTGLPAGQTAAPATSYCMIVNAHYLGQTGSIVVDVSNSP